MVSSISFNFVENPQRSVQNSFNFVGNPFNFVGNPQRFVQNPFILRELPVQIRRDSFKTRSISLQIRRDPFRIRSISLKIRRDSFKIRSNLLEIRTDSFNFVGNPQRFVQNPFILRKLLVSNSYKFLQNSFQFVIQEICKDLFEIRSISLEIRRDSFKFHSSFVNFLFKHIERFVQFSLEVIFSENLFYFLKLINYFILFIQIFNLFWK